MHHPISAPTDANDDLEVEYNRQQGQRRSNLWSTRPDHVSPAPSQRISRLPNEFLGHGYTYAVNPIPHECPPLARDGRKLANLREANNPPPARCTRSQTDPAHDEPPLQQRILGHGSHRCNSEWSAPPFQCCSPQRAQRRWTISYDVVR